MLRAAQVVDVLERLFDGVGQAIEDLVLVDRAVRSALAGCAVVRHHDDERVVQLATLLEVVEQPADLMVGVAQEACVDLRHAGEDVLLVVSQRGPRPDDIKRAPALAVGPVRSVYGLIGDSSAASGMMPIFFWFCEDELPIGLVAHVELALVLVRPLLRDMMRSVGSAGCVVEEERLVRRDDLGVTDERDRLVRDVDREVIALLRALGLLDRMVVVDDVRVPLVRFGAQEAVEALEAATERPVLLRRSHVHLVFGRQVPLAHDVRVPAALAEDLRQQRALARDVAARIREAGGGLGDAGHAVRGVVAAGQETRASGRAQGRGVEVRVLQAMVGDAVDVRRLDQTAVRLHGREANVIEHEVEDVR